MSKPKTQFINPPAGILYFYFATQEALREWVDGVKTTNGPALVRLPADEDGIVNFYLLQGRVLGLILKEEAAKQ